MHKDVGKADFFYCSQEILYQLSLLLANSLLQILYFIYLLLLNLMTMLNHYCWFHMTGHS